MTTVQEWRAKREQGIEIELPEYGDVVRIRPMDVEFFFKSGRVPDFLAETVQDMIGGNSYTLPFPQREQKTQEWLTWLDELIKFAFVSPKVVDDPQNDNEIGIDEIGYRDKLHVYTFFGRPASVIRSFRQKQEKPVASVHAEQGNGTDPKPSIEDTPVVESTVGDAGRGNGTVVR